MVKMENYYSQEKCRELWRKIDQLHFSYLEMEESPEKILHREKLEDCIADFLFLANHRDKFVFAETEEVLYRSAKMKKDFSGYKATTGWNSLQIYASNLITQPWRREYRQVKKYCGFYKHQIEANLLGAEIIFQAMGYRPTDNGVLILEDPICPDKASNVSRDCLVAYVECQILKFIWEEVSQAFNVSWLDILEYRMEYPGNIDQCVKSIQYLHNFKQLPPQISPPEVRHVDTRPTFNNLVPISNSHGYSEATVSGHNNVVLPPVVVPPAHYCAPHTNGCLNSMLTYHYGTYPTSMPIIKPSPVQNNYYYNPNGAGYPVPTAQLIELDNRQNGYDIVDEGLSRNRKSRAESNGVVIANGDAAGGIKNGIEPSPDDKQEEEDWGYVYRNLERKGYSKDLGERGDVLGLAVSDKPGKSSKTPKKVKATNLDEALHSLTVSNRPLKMTEALEHMEKKPMERQRERRHSQGSTYENVANEPLKNAGRSTNSLSVQKQSKPDLDQPHETKKTEERKQVRAISKWECKSCTFLNDYSKDICEMCSKSRLQGQEQTMEVGGPECSQCTLVNPRTAKNCQACSNDLTNSPTYI